MEWKDKKIGVRRQDGGVLQFSFRMFSNFSDFPLHEIDFNPFNPLHPLSLNSDQALERQKEYTDAIRVERDELREEVVKLKDILKVSCLCVSIVSVCGGSLCEAHLKISKIPYLIKSACSKSQCKTGAMSQFRSFII